MSQVGEGVDHVSPGDRVVCSFIMSRGTCRRCTNGLAEICETFFTNNRINGRLLDGTTRLHRPDGVPVAMYPMSGHATEAIVPTSAVLSLPDSVPLQDAAILGCSIFTAYGFVHDVAAVQPGENVAVVAAGGIGLSIIHLACAAGAPNVVAIDVDEEKLALAEELGATLTFNSTTTDPATAIHEHLGQGVNVAFEASGSTPTPPGKPWIWSTTADTWCWPASPRRATLWTWKSPRWCAAKSRSSVRLARTHKTPCPRSWHWPNRDSLICRK